MKTSYTILVAGDDDRYVDTDIVDLIEGHYNVKAKIGPGQLVTHLTMVDTIGNLVSAERVVVDVAALRAGYQIVGRRHTFRLALLRLFRRTLAESFYEVTPRFEVLGPKGSAS